MAKKSKSNKDEFGPRWKPVLRAAVWVLIIGALAGACWLGAARGWQAVEHRPEFRLNLHALTLRDCPDWVDCENMNRHLRGQMKALPADASLFRQDIARAVQHEMRASPWLLEVQEVDRVLPNNLQIRAVFRKPAGIARWNKQDYLVDKEGCYLPEEFFSAPPAWEGEDTPRIVDDILHEAPPIGRPWDGPRMAVGARLSDFLRRKGVLERLRLSTINVTGVGRYGTEPPILLVTDGGAKIKWGSSSLYKDVPGLSAAPSGPSDEEKLDMLLSKLGDHPGLRGIRYIDLRYHGKIIFAPEGAASTGSKY